MGFVLFLLKFFQVVLEAVKALFPEDAVVFQPVHGLLHRLGLDAAGAPLGVASAADELGAFQHLQVLGDGGKAHAERGGQVVHRNLPLSSEARKDGPPGRIGQGGKRSGEVIGGHFFVRSFGSLFN